MLSYFPCTIPAREENALLPHNIGCSSALSQISWEEQTAHWQRYLIFFRFESISDVIPSAAQDKNVKCYD